MEPSNQARCTAFEGARCIASGTLADVALAASATVSRGASVLIFDDDTGEPIEVDFRGTPEEVLGRLTASRLVRDERTRVRGRPKLGVVAREVTLLPRHWEWLNGQPGGASVALRKRVEEAGRVNAGRDRARRAQEAAYRFMSAMAGDLPGFEEATRAFFARDSVLFESLTERWPIDIRDHARRMAVGAFAGA
jgi:hypothetical protein